jgi:hypothetical protein
LTITDITSCQYTFCCPNELESRGEGSENRAILCDPTTVRGLRLAFLLPKLGSPRKDQFLSGIEQRRRLKRFIDPHPQVAINKQLLGQPGRQIGQAPTEAGAQLQILEQQQGDERDPNLDVQGVGVGAHKSFDSQVLLEALKNN